MVRRIRHPRTRLDRPGFTLLELALVLAILGTLMAISWPLVLNAYADQDLKQAAQNVRIQLLSTRNRAIRAGEIYQFRVEPGGTGYFSVSYAMEEFQSQQADGGTALQQGQLPEGLQFVPAPESPLLSERISTGSLSGFVSFRELAGTEWSQPFLFFPDGTAQQLSFRVMDSDQKFVTLSIHQLTGRVDVGPVEREAGL
ncbi:prepilin-type N-terminal cleavage/methylation domain-containing protein [Rubinisphaera sp. JC750]|uniref:prepilin-type N-terminal cleavage/methylation domain-containing protein n=1 Tax=Rubinisphaera sp. JC750 TaxID=2898658 RepID=UPI001F29964F|nr:prepilin-type N-terminal cleavage/methylation domain-containing protein [Rubinisphaera sp. JC750]